ncbi:hypothetical protein VaNZ11_013815 [Volvox africanus]|uniref:AB hydrolase-1 domain-containing protein n=1 Tax=Volvox africanus TaxID=51714 RepID=A0ABQ5SH10_9CHLO|nr:hypothetical protein VaNZ11_013815 [Volvox africanus]
MWMWNLESPRILGTLAPRLSKSAVCLRSRWQRFRNAHRISDNKVTTNGPNSTNLQLGAQRRRWSSGSGSTRLVTRSVTPSTMTPISSSSSSRGSEVQDLAVDLDYTPSLGPFREVLCVLATVLLVGLSYVATGQLHGGSWLAILTSTVLAAALASLARTAWLEKAYKARERAFAALGDWDSRFWSITVAAGSGGLHPMKQLVVHVKVKVGDLAQPFPYDGPAGNPDGLDINGDAAFNDGGGTNPMVGNGGTTTRVLDSVPAVHCYHGFGANLGSYKRVQEQMAEALRGVVTAHDMPGFGLTQRPSDISSYFLAFNGRLGRLVMDYELHQLGLISSRTAEHHDSRGSLQGNTGASSGAAAATSPPPMQQQQVKGEASTSTSTSPLLTWAGGGSVTSILPAPKAGGAAGDLTMTVGSTTDGARGPGEGAAQQQEQLRPPRDPPRAIKRILVGHSLGGACASLEAVSSPTDLDGLVLVAPAVFALPGPEYQGVTLSPNRPDKTTDTTGGNTDATNAAAKAERFRTSAARAAAILGSEPYGSHVTDPPEVRRLYPVGRMPHLQVGVSAGDNVSGGNGSNVGRSGWGLRVGPLLRTARSLLVVLASLAMVTVLRLMTPVITLLLRSLVRQRTFWLKGLQQAYYNPGAVTQDIVDSYRQPQLVSGWEVGLVKFLLARLTRPTSGIGELLRNFSRLLQPTTTAAVLATTAAVAASDAKREGAAAMKSPISPVKAPPGAKHNSKRIGDGAVTPDTRGAVANAVDGGNSDDDGDLATRLAVLVASTGLPVLIIHGLFDKLVPASNSQRLARMLPGCELVLLDKCGHMPQEELPEIFVSLVAEFAARLPERGAREGPQGSRGSSINSPGRERA